MSNGTPTVHEILRAAPLLRFRILRAEGEKRTVALVLPQKGYVTVADVLGERKRLTPATVSRGLPTRVLWEPPGLANASSS